MIIEIFFIIGLTGFDENNNNNLIKAYRTRIKLE